MPQTPVTPCSCNLQELLAQKDAELEQRATLLYKTKARGDCLARGFCMSISTVEATAH